MLPIVIVLVMASICGLWYQRSRGTVKAKAGRSLISQAMIGGALGSSATLVQFSSAFCTPCRATRVLLENIVAGMPDVAHVEVDAEAQLDLVRQLNIISTPTTLILNSQGLEVGRAVGAPKREQVINALAAIRN